MGTRHARAHVELDFSNGNGAAESWRIRAVRGRPPDPPTAEERAAAARAAAHQTRQATRIGAEDAHMMHATRIEEARPDGVQTRRATRAGDGNGLMILRNGDEWQLLAPSQL